MNGRISVIEVDKPGLAPTYKRYERSFVSQAEACEWARNQCKNPWMVVEVLWSGEGLAGEQWRDENGKWHKDRYS